MTIKEENIQFQLVSNSEFEELFACVKQGIFIHVDSVFGWDDDFQHQRLLNDYHPSWFHWVYRGKERIGLVLMPLELSERGISNDNLGSLMALIILGGMAVQPLVPIMSKYFGRIFLMAIYCLLGVAAIAITTTSNDINVLGAGLFVLGMAVFALYPVAINLGCDKLDASYIVSATQVMLFSYSVGSVAGPVLADWFMLG